MPDWYEKLEALFEQQIGKGEMAGTAYDTAWVASVPDPEQPDRPAFPQALEWLRLHQNSDGSWGSEVEYYHDHVLSTLIACIVLAEWHPDEWAEYQVSAGLKAIWQKIVGLKRDPSITVGFELILPTMLRRAESLGFQLPYACFNGYRSLRSNKLALIPPNLVYSRYVTSTFSLEFLGDEVSTSRLNDNIIEDNGSVACSPSASSFYVRTVGGARTFRYLKDIVAHARGAIPALAPIDIYERIWALNNLYLVRESFPPEVQPHLEALAALWSIKGVSFGRFYSVPDLDNTTVSFTLLTRCGHQLDPIAFTPFERENHFVCYQYEQDPSPSLHVHLVEALSLVGPSKDRDRMLNKALQFLDRSRVYETFWFDKWHSSPYYTTAHAIIGVSRIEPRLIENAITWLIQTQRPDGSWGYLESTAEETAYALQALLYYQRHIGPIPGSTIKQGIDYLTKSAELRQVKYTPLWLSKTLYTPTWIVHSTVLSALAMAG